MIGSLFEKASSHDGFGRTRVRAGLLGVSWKGDLNSVHLKIKKFPCRAERKNNDEYRPRSVYVFSSGSVGPLSVGSGVFYSENRGFSVGDSVNGPVWNREKRTRRNVLGLGASDSAD